MTRIVLSWRSAAVAASLVFLVAAPLRAQEARVVPLTALDLTKLRQGWGEPQVDRSVEAKPMAIGGRAFERGVGSHAPGRLHVQLDGLAERFRAWVGVDDETSGRGTVSFTIYGDDRRLFDSGPRKGGDDAVRVDVELTGVHHLVLVMGACADGIDHDHADWGNAEFVVRGADPVAVDGPREEPVILTPPPGPEPHLGGPEVQGARPGHPFLFRVPCTGVRPIRFAAEGLPTGLALDPATGIVRGQTPTARGAHRFTIRARNEHGASERGFTLVVGDTLALTPPMGWNSWYIHYHRVSDADMRAAADAMIRSGMADFGYQYVNIDDCWMVKPGADDPRLGGPPRGADGAIRPNGKFPDMTALADYVHERGLKVGLYTSPGPLTCAGYAGSYEHELADARQFAAWGFDFLKYDWCSYGQVATGEGRARLTAPYQKMGAILAGLDRDIVFNLCQYGMGEVWEWGGDVGGNCWRTTGDLGLVGGELSLGIYEVGLRNAALWEHAGPGRWNDPDYLLIGHVGKAQVAGEGAPTTLTPNEQYSHMSMWCLMAAPLIFSGDMTKLDPFTLNVLCNAEVIAVDQDRQGRQARVVRRSPDELVLEKPLADGSLAVGLFALGEVGATLAVSWKELGLDGAQVVRDLWRQRDVGVFEDGWAAPVARHGVAMVRVRPASDRRAPVRVPE